MLNYHIYANITGKLKKLSALSPQLLKGGGNYTNHCLLFLNELQTYADENNLYISTDIALAIEKIIVFKPAVSAEQVTRPNPRKEKDAYCVNCMENLFKELNNFLEKDRRNFEECSDIWRQVLSRFISKGYDEQIASINNEIKLDTIIYIVKTDPELSPYYYHLLGLLGVVNLKVILDLVLPQIGF